MRLVYIAFISALAGSNIALIYLVGSLMGRVRVLERKAFFHEEKIFLLSNELDMCRIYLRDHCMFCMYDMDSDRREEETK